MPRRRRYLEEDVLTAARARVHRLFDLVDTVSVMFSGGKDSLTTLHLVREEAERRGRLPVQAMFRDEELIPDSVINFVNEYRQQPWLDLKWLAVPLQSTKFVLGVVSDYTQWDPGREHVRPVPPWAITLEPGDDRVFDQYAMDAYSATFYEGKIAFVTGIRAAESLMRFRASVNKLGQDSWVNNSNADNAVLAKPIYDWEEDDIFKFLGEEGIPYCPIYDHQMFNNERMRVSTPLHQERAKSLWKMRATDPEFFDRVMRVFPEAEIQWRYFQEFDQEKVLTKYGRNYATVLQWINEFVTDPRQHNRALTAYRDAVRRANRTGRDLYPPRYLLQQFLGGAYKRTILPKGKGERAGTY